MHMVVQRQVNGGITINPNLNHGGAFIHLAGTWYSPI